MKHYLVLLLLLPLLAACTTSPTSGRPIFTGVVGENDENAIGVKEHPKIIRQFHGVNDNDALNAYVAQIGARLIPAAERRGLRWTFTVLNDDRVNAFAVPGGYIYITRGLLGLANDESEVASVLAHEMGHINARHSAQQMSQGLIANIGLQAVGIATGSSAAAQLGGTGAELYMKSYSRSHEYEADALSVRYLSAAGYDPFATERFLRRLQDNTILDARIHGGNSDAGLGEFFSTHPQTPERIAAAHALALQVPPNPNATIDRASYMRAIDGTKYGRGDIEGIVNGRTFIHPKLKISFTVPDGFVIKNSANNVTATNDRGAAIVFDVAQSDVDNVAAYVGVVWAGNRPLQQPERITVNGLDGATAAATLNAPDGQKDARFVALSRGDLRYFRLLFITPSGEGAAYADAFRKTTYSFKYGTVVKKPQSRRIRVVPVRNGQTVRDLAGMMHVDDFALERFCVMNGVAVNSVLTAGSSVKIVE